MRELCVSGRVYYHISAAMQYSNMALETTALVIYDPNTFFFMITLFIMGLILFDMIKHFYIYIQFQRIIFEP